MRPKKYPKIAEDLTKMIVDGQIGSGEQLPSQHQLTLKYGVSRSCAQKALDLLEERGLVDKRPGKGVFVKSAPEPAELGRAIGLLFPDFKRTTPAADDSFGVETLWGIEEAVRDRGLNLVLRRHERDSTFEDIAAVLASMEVDGLLVDRDLPDECIRMAVVPGIPVVVAGRLSVVPGVGCTVPNFYDYIYQTLGALGEQGVKHAAIIYPGPHDYSREMLGAVNRLRIEQRSIAVDLIDCFTDGQAFDATLEEKLTKQTVHELVDRDALPEVILCLSDWTALRILEVLKARNIPVPGRVGVIGCLGIGIGEQVTPTISTLAVDSRALGSKAVEILADMVFAGQPARIERLPLTFIERESFRWRNGTPG
ncbi:MAG: GntR family transcriptional regulator [Kiritimatiellae bacterium]|nr:GntR family transcriptional regulator [Kiritimatiellia bacterium]